MTESSEGEANMNIDGGKLVIVRYQKSKYIHNAGTAYANAIQTPGAMPTDMMSLFWGMGSGAASTMRMPHLFDVIVWLDKIFHTGTSSESPSQNNYSFFRGIESEVDDFFAMSPKVFFINCVLTTGLNCVRSASTIYVVFPVILKRGKYYIIMGEENTPVYRVNNPKQLFFTPHGKHVLRYLLSRHLGEGSSLDFFVSKEGKSDLYCVPKCMNGSQSNKWDEISNRWDDCNTSVMKEHTTVPIVEQPDRKSVV